MSMLPAIFAMNLPEGYVLMRLDVINAQLMAAAATRSVM